MFVKDCNAPLSRELVKLTKRAFIKKRSNGQSSQQYCSCLQRTFVSSLAADYAMWAKSKQYRDARKQYAVESDKELIG